MTITKQKQIHRYREQADGYQGEREDERGKIGKEVKKYKLLYIQYINQRDILKNYSKYFIIALNGV